MDSLMKYNIWNAVTYEVTVMLINFDARWMNSLHHQHDPFIYSFQRLVRVETEQTMEDVDTEQTLHKLWEQEDDDYELIIETDPETKTTFGFLEIDQTLMEIQVTQIKLFLMNLTRSQLPR